MFSCLINLIRVNFLIEKYVIKNLRRKATTFQINTKEFEIKKDWLKRLSISYNFKKYMRQENKKLKNKDKLIKHQRKLQLKNNLSQMFKWIIKLFQINKKNKTNHKLKIISK